MKIDIRNIKVGARHRKDMGDIEALANSIAEQGLLQPIGITAEHELVFGERRLRACRDILGLTEIDARVVDVRSIVEGELHENEIRKDFTPSERVAIAGAVRAQFGDRQGRRTDIEPRENIPEVPRGTRTSEVAAKKAGFGNRKTLEQAQQVVEQAEPEVVDAMDRGDLSISAAAVVSEAPPDEQRQIAAVSPAERKEAVRQLRNARSNGQTRETDLERKMTVYMAIETLVDPPIAPSEMAGVLFGNEKQFLRRNLPTAIGHLNQLQKEIGDEQKRTG